MSAMEGQRIAPRAEEKEIRPSHGIARLTAWLGRNSSDEEEEKSCLLLQSSKLRLGDMTRKRYRRG